MENFDSRFQEYDDMLAGLSSDEEEKDKSKEKKKAPDQKPKEQNLSPSQNKFPSNFSPANQINKPASTTGQGLRPVASYGDDYDELMNKMDEEEEEKVYNDEIIQKKPVITDKQPIRNDPLPHPQQNVKPKPSKDPIPEIIEKESKYSNSAIIQSFSIINSEISYLNEGLKRKDLDKRLLMHLKETLDKIYNNKKNLENSYQSGKLTGKTYLGILEQCISEHQTLFKEAKSTGDKQILGRLAKRLDLLTKEKTKIKPDPMNEFIKLMKAINPNLQVDPNKKFMSEPGKPQNTQLKVPKLASDFQKKHEDDIDEDEVDNLPQMKKILYFKKRHKQYHNLAMYYIKQMKDRKENELNNIYIPKLQRFKTIVESLINGENIKLAPIFATECPEITPELFQGDDNFQFNLQNLIEKLKGCIEEESNYYNTIFDISRFRAKADECKRRKADYEKMLQLLESIVSDPWIPLPLYQITQESRLTCIENKDLDHTDMKICFKQFLNAPHKNCYISYFIEINGKSYKEITPASDDHYNLQYEKMFKIGDSRKTIDKELYKKTINILVLRKKFFGTEEVGNAHIELKELLTNNRYEGKAQILCKGKSFQLDFGIYLRDSLRKDDKKFEVIKFLKVYPRFNLNEGVEEYLKQPINVNQTKSEASDNKIPSQQAIKEEKKEEPQQEPEIIPQGVDINQIKVLRHSKNDPSFAVLSQSEDIPNGITKNDVLIPEDCEKCPCLSFIELMIPKFQKAKVEFVKEYDKEASKFVEDQYNKYYKQNLLMPQKVESGQLSAMDYKNMLVDAKKRDLLLLEFYEKKKAKDWALFVRIRLAFLDNEIKDLEENMG